MNDNVLTTPSRKRWSAIMKFPNGTTFASTTDRLLVVRTVEDLNDGRTWLHVSLTRRDRMPTLAELRMVKDEFIGPAEAYQIFPPTDQHDNPNANRLHLWSCLEGPVIPDNNLRMLAMTAQDRLAPGRKG